MLFLHYCRRFGVLTLLIGSADSQGVHAIFQHPAADSQHVGGMCLYVGGSFKGVQDNFAFEFHHGFFERQPTARVSSRSEVERVSLQDRRQMLGGDLLEPLDQMNACSMMFSISRTLPGQG